MGIHNQNLKYHEKKQKTLIEQASEKVSGFETLYLKLKRSIELAGKSQSTLTNYARCLANMALHFNYNPIELDEEQVLDYLHYLKDMHDTPSESFFKHTVYGLRYAYKIFDMKDKHVKLPSIERQKDLPVVLSQKEMKAFINIPKLLKHRIIIGLLYGCGLRCFELRNLLISDIDFDRMMVHVQKGKGRKDRYVPFDSLLARGIRDYLEAEKPVKWLFNGNNAEGEIVPLSQRGVQWAVKEAKKRSEIKKDITAHTLRHSYATHLLEMGLDIVSIKDLLGHEHIQTTMIYLHVCNLDKLKPFSPLGRLFDFKQ